MNIHFKVQTLFFTKINQELIQNLKSLGIVLLKETKPLVYIAIIPEEVTPRMIFDTEVGVIGRDSKGYKIYTENHAAVTVVGPYIVSNEEYEKLITTNHL